MDLLADLIELRDQFKGRAERIDASNAGILDKASRLNSATTHYIRDINLLITEAEHDLPKKEDPPPSL